MTLQHASAPMLEPGGGGGGRNPVSPIRSGGSGLNGVLLIELFSDLTVESGTSMSLSCEEIDGVWWTGFLPLGGKKPVSPGGSGPLRVGLDIWNPDSVSSWVGETGIYSLGGAELDDVE